MKVYVLGDSISIHYGPFLKNYLKGVMEYARKEGEEEALLNLDNPQGANGGDSGMVLSFLKGKVLTGGVDADLLLINCGLHDIKTDPVTGRKQIAIDQYERNLCSILEVVSTLRAKPVWIRTTPCDDIRHNQLQMQFKRFEADVIAYNAVGDRVMRGGGIPSVDLHTFTLNLGPDLYVDHIHFQEPIRALQAAFIAGWLMANEK